MQLIDPPKQLLCEDVAGSISLDIFVQIELLEPEVEVNRNTRLTSNADGGISESGFVFEEAGHF